MRPELARSELRTRIALAIGDLLGSPAVEIYIDRDLIVCTRRKASEPAREAPADRELIDAIEALTGRSVVTFLDASEPDPLVAAQLFFLEPQGEYSPKAFTLSAESSDGTAILSVAGDIDCGTAAEVEREAHGQVRRRARNLVLDLSRTTFMDTGAVDLMEKLSALAGSAGGGLTVVLTSRRARRLLELIPPSSPVNVVESLAAAVSRPASNLADTA